VAAGYALNLPPVEVTGGHGAEPLVTLDGDANVLIEAVKLADDRSGDVIVRLYEGHGVAGTASVRASFPAAGMELTDLLERRVAGTGPEIRLRPFQIVTVRIRR
jgi:alpha-mannosidase